MNKTRWILLFLLISTLACANETPAGPDMPEPQNIPLVEHTTSLSALETSSLVQAGLQEKGFQVRFVQSVEKGLQRYQEYAGYFRVIVFDPPAADIPAGDAGDELHVFVPLRIAVIETPQGARVSSIPYAKVTYGFSADASLVMQQWGNAIESVIMTLPD